MKTTLDLPAELIQEVKLRTVLQGRTMKSLVAEILRQGLGIASVGQVEKRLAGAMVEIGGEGLPVIRCAPHAPATRMSAEELLKFEEETQAKEDLKQGGVDAAQSRNGDGCRTGNHDFSFFDSCPGFEIYECRKCKLRKFVDLKTGNETFQ